MTRLLLPRAREISSGARTSVTIKKVNIVRVRTSMGRECVGRSRLRSSSGSRSANWLVVTVCTRDRAFAQYTLVCTRSSSASCRFYGPLYCCYCLVTIIVLLTIKRIPVFRVKRSRAVFLFWMIGGVFKIKFN